jgi:lysine 6-dehydrogenase
MGFRIIHPVFLQSYLNTGEYPLILNSYIKRRKSMKRILVLGAGMVGSAMALDMSKKHRVHVADINPEALKKLHNTCDSIFILELDVRKENDLKKILDPFDLVISAVPGYLGYRTLKTLIDARKNIVDISFLPENVLELNEEAKNKNITAIVDCGVAPGMDNILLGYYDQKLKISDFECLVGGLPKVKKWPFNYKAPFSPMDVIEEYTRPARYVEGGKIITREALSDCVYIEFDRVGTLEAFNTDGLRSLMYTMNHIPNMKEKTLRYPGHVELIKALKASGFFDEEKRDIAGYTISPREFSSHILFREWKQEEGEEEITVMRIRIEGLNEKGQPERVLYELYDTYDKASGISSMARTTGYTATAAANMFLDGIFTEKGLFPPELIGKNEACFTYIMRYLKERNIEYIRKK